MQLLPDMVVCIGRRKFKDEMPDKVFAAMSEDWKPEQKARWLKTHCPQESPVKAESVETVTATPVKAGKK